MSYTQLAVAVVVVAIVIDVVVIRTRLLFRKGFWTAYAIVISFQLLTNAWLTNDVRVGTAIVNYNPNEILGIRLAYAPIEDLLFGFAMVLLTLVSWVYWGRRSARASSSKPRRPSNA